MGVSVEMLGVRVGGENGGVPVVVGSVDVWLLGLGDVDYEGGLIGGD